MHPPESNDTPETQVYELEVSARETLEMRVHMRNSRGWPRNGAVGAHRNAYFFAIKQRVAGKYVLFVVSVCDKRLFHFRFVFIPNSKKCD